MTVSEKAELLAHPAAQGRTLVWDMNPNGQWAALKAGPCPFLDGQSSCSVYAVRPTNCRRFGCFRASVAEPFLDKNGGALFDVSRAVRRGVHRLVVQSRRWAESHGW